MYRKAKRDKNETRLVEYFRRCGCTVAFLDDAGIPDLLVGYNGHNLLVEVKMPKGKLTPKQLEFFATWKGCSYVVHSIAEANALLKLYKYATRS